jgi:hypothetical protein
MHCHMHCYNNHRSERVACMVTRSIEVLHIRCFSSCAGDGALDDEPNRPLDHSFQGSLLGSLRSDNDFPHEGHAKPRTPEISNCMESYQRLSDAVGKYRSHGVALVVVRTLIICTESSQNANNWHCAGILRNKRKQGLPVQTCIST